MLVTQAATRLRCEQAGRFRIMASAVRLRTLEARCCIAVAAPEKTRVVHPDIPAYGTPASLSLERVLERAYPDSEQLRKQIGIYALRWIYAEFRKIVL